MDRICGAPCTLAQGIDEGRDGWSRGRGRGGVVVGRCPRSSLAGKQFGCDLLAASLWDRWTRIDCIPGRQGWRGRRRRLGQEFIPSTDGEVDGRLQARVEECEEVYPECVVGVDEGGRRVLESGNVSRQTGDETRAEEHSRTRTRVPSDS